MTLSNSLTPLPKPAHKPVKLYLTSHIARPANRLVFTSLAGLTTLAAILAAVGASAAAEPTKAPRCSVVYINGDAIISCPKGTR